MSDTSLGASYRYGEHRGTEPPRFCRGCGRAMRESYEYGPLQLRFDSDGRPAYRQRHVRCSASRWRRIFDLITLSPLHDHALQDANGDWPWI